MEGNAVCIDDSFREVTSVAPSGDAEFVVRAFDGWTGEAIENVSIVAFLLEEGDEDFVPVFDLKPFHNDCVQAVAQTDSDGRAHFTLPEGPMHFGHLSDPLHEGWTTEAVRNVAVAPGGRMDLALYPEQIQAYWNDTFTATDPLDLSTTTMVRTIVPPGKGVIERIDSFGFYVGLSWNNTPTAWADLYPGIGTDGYLYTDDFFNAEQDMFSGNVTENGLDFYREFEDHACDFMEDGIDAFVYDPGAASAPTGLPFSFMMAVDMNGFVDWEGTGPC